MNKKYILLAGAMRAGKDTFANAIIQTWPNLFTKISLADELKEKEKELRQIYFDFFRDQLGSIGQHLLDNAYDDFFAAKNGVALQQLGTQWMRSADHDYWIKALEKRAQKAKQQYIIVPDCRFENEFYSKVLLPGWRVIVYAENSTLQARLDEIKDTRRLWTHESEALAAKLYGKIRQYQSTPGEFNDLSEVAVFNTSEMSILSYENAAIKWVAEKVSELCAC